MIADQVKAFLRANPFEVASGVAVALLGVVESGGALSIITGVRVYQNALPLLFIGLAMGVVVALHRAAPAWGLAVLWGCCALQVIEGADVLAAQAVALVLATYGAARYGSAATVWGAAVTVPLTYLIGLAYVIERAQGFQTLYVLGQVGVHLGVVPRGLLLAGGVIVPFGVPMLVGLTLRMRDRARRSEEQTQEAQQVAQARTAQTRLANEVHDVVGHSLAVIIAQAGSAQFLPDDPARLKQTLETIATSARESLGDVRRVLTATADGVTPLAPGTLDDLIEGVRSSLTLTSTVSGQPRQLDGEVALVAYRVLQEMLTNVLKHGAAGRAVAVDRSWQDAAVTVQVSNEVSPDRTTSAGGQGLPGMHRRLDSVGGRLETVQDGSRFTVRAWMPTTTEPGPAA